MKKINFASPSHLFKATAIAPANIAFTKYWGKRSEHSNIPFTNSISMNLSECFTKTTVEFDKELKTDVVKIDRQTATTQERDRVSKFLDVVRKLAKIKTRAKVVSENSFPKGTGIASSSSAFAALALAGSYAAGLRLNKTDLSKLARLGSGSACRSIPDGFAEWRKGHNHKTSYAVQLASPDFWDLRDIVVVLSQKEKKIGSSQGHNLAPSSPFYKKRLQILPERIKKLRKALLERNLPVFGEILEQEAVELHVMAMTSTPSIFYLEPKTWEIINRVREWRDESLLVYFTLDAGPNLHLICLEKNEKGVLGELKKIAGIKKVIINQPAIGARLVNSSS